MDSFMSRDFGKVLVAKHTYPDGNLAVQLIAESDGEELTMLSVNLPEHVRRLKPNEFFAKDYAENGEIAEEALASGLFKDTGGRVEYQFLVLSIWRFR